MVNLDRRIGSYNTLDDLFGRVCVPNEAEDLNFHVFSLIKGTNESRTLTKHIPCKCECKFDGRKCNLNQKWNSDSFGVSLKIQKNIVYAKKVIFGILQHVAAKMVNIQGVLVIQ